MTHLIKHNRLSSLITLQVQESWEGPEYEAKLFITWGFSWVCCRRGTV